MSLISQFHDTTQCRVTHCPSAGQVRLHRGWKKLGF